MKSNPARLSTCRKLAFAAGGLFAGLVIAEGAVRAFVPVRNVGPSFSEFDATYGKALKRNFECSRVTPEFTMQFRTNSLGFRGPEPESPLEGVVLFIGDSFTMGYGVDDGKEYAALIRNALDDRLGSERVPVINAGIGNTGNGRWVKFLSTEAAQYDPRGVVLQLSGNDFSDNVRERMFRVTKGEQLTESPLRQRAGMTRLAQRLVEAIPGLPYSYLVSLLREVATRAATTPPAQQQDVPMGQPYDTTPGDDLLTYRLIEEILAICRKKEWPVVVILVGVDPPRLAHLVGMLRQREVPYVVAPSKKERPELYYVVDGHWNAAGHAYVADAIMDNTPFMDGMLLPGMR